MYIQYNVMRFNTLFIIFTLDIKQCPMYMSLKNSLHVETFSNNFPKLINNSSSLIINVMVFSYLILIGIDVVILIFLSP